MVSKGIWATTTAYSLGDVVVPGSGFTGAGGKFLQCTTAGTSGSTTTLAVPNPGSTLADGTVTWTAVSGMPSELSCYAALFVINKGLRASTTAYSSGDVISLTCRPAAPAETLTSTCTSARRRVRPRAASQPRTSVLPGEAITDGTAVFTELSNTIQTNTGFPAGFTEVAGGSYARVRVSAAAALQLTDWAGTQSAGSTTSSTGTNGATSNNAAITFPAPTATWANGLNAIGAVLLYDQAASGNLITWGALTVPKTVNNGDAAPSFAISAFTAQIDN